MNDPSGIVEGLAKLCAPVQRKPRPGDVLECVVEEIDARGRGVARTGDMRVVLVHAIPGARVRAQVVRRRGTRVEARLLEVLDPGPDAVEPRCSHFGTCGGCSFQHLAYPAQLDALRRHVQRCLAREGLEGVRVEDVLPSPRIWHYRNKMDFTFGTRRWIEPEEAQGVDASFALGLHVAERWQKVLDVRSCALAFEGADAILTSARELARERSLPPWDAARHHGLLRHLVLRKGFHTGEILLALVTSEEASDLVAPYLAALCQRHPEITTCVQMIHARAAAVAMGEREIVHLGSGLIHERLGELVFAISAGSFFQTNTEQAERLMAIVREEAALPEGGVVWDLYCGAGTIGLSLATAGARVLGIESVPSAVADARANAARNGVDSATFFLGEVESELPALVTTHARPDVCVVDPPRAGLHARALATLASIVPARLVYVSCNVEAAARDLAILCARGFELVRARPLDLFPHTPHVECVFTLSTSSPGSTGSSSGSTGA